MPHAGPTDPLLIIELINAERDPFTAKMVLHRAGDARVADI
jgi:hypothetical protein